MVPEQPEDGTRCSSPELWVRPTRLDEKRNRSPAPAFELPRQTRHVGTMTVLNEYFWLVGEKMAGLDDTEDHVVVLPAGGRSSCTERLVEATQGAGNIPSYCQVAAGAQGTRQERPMRRS